jgi:hypothetical protein
LNPAVIRQEMGHTSQRMTTLYSGKRLVTTVWTEQVWLRMMSFVGTSGAFHLRRDESVARNRLDLSDERIVSSAARDPCRGRRPWD